MHRKLLAFALAAALMLALIPAANASVAGVKSVSVFNYNQNNTAKAYNPAASNSSKTYSIIQAPYDEIAKSNAYGYRNYGPNYKVIIYLNDAVYGNNNIYLETSDGYGGYIDAGGAMGSAGWYDSSAGAIYATFTPARGGNSTTYSLRIYNPNTSESTTHNMTIHYVDADSSAPQASIYTNKLSNSMRVTVDGSGTYYTAYTNNNTLYIDYKSSMVPVGSQINLNFHFTDASGYALPGGYNEGYIYSVSSGGNSPFIYPSNYDRSGNPPRGKVTGNVVSFPVSVDPTNSYFYMNMETASALHQSSRMSIVWRDVSSSVNTQLQINPSRSPVIAVGQEYTFTVGSYSAYETGTSFYLDVGGTAGVVTTSTGKSLTIRGLSVGSTYLNVRNNAGTVLDKIYVTVVATPAEAGTALTTQFGSYVAKNAVAVYSGPAESYVKLGALKAGDIISVQGFQGNWACISWSTTGIAYVPKSAVSRIASSTSYNYVTGSYDYYPNGIGTAGGGAVFGDWGGTALGDTPNILVPGGGMGYKVGVDVIVRTGPGGWYRELGTATKGMSVLVHSIDNTGWANIQWNNTVGYVPASILVK